MNTLLVLTRSTRFGPANQTTTVRAALVAIVAGLLFERPTPILAAAAAARRGVAAILDGLDGWLARTSGMSSAFGARFDLEVDALLIMALAMLAWQHEKAGAWILLSGLLRYLFIAGGLLWSLAAATASAEPAPADDLRRPDRRPHRGGAAGCRAAA